MSILTEMKHIEMRQLLQLPQKKPCCCSCTMLQPHFELPSVSNYSLFVEVVFVKLSNFHIFSPMEIYMRMLNSGQLW